MAAGEMFAGDRPLPRVEAMSRHDRAALGAPDARLHELAEEIVRAALELDAAHPDAARLQELARAIREPEAHPAGRSGGVVHRGRRVGQVVRALVPFVTVITAVLVGTFVGRSLVHPVVAAAPATVVVQGDAQVASQSLVTALLTSAFEDQVSGHASQAAATYLEVLKRDGENRTALYNLGVIAQAASRAGEAEERYRATLAADPTYWPAMFNLAIIRTSAGAETEAIDLYREVVRLDPANAPAHLNLGILLQRAGQETAAAAEVERAFALDPTLARRAGAR